jgi:hypothetical protein
VSDSQQRPILEGAGALQALDDHDPDPEGLGRWIARALVKGALELGTEPLLVRSRQGRVMHVGLPLARPDHAFGKIAELPVERLEPSSDAR